LSSVVHFQASQRYSKKRALVIQIRPIYFSRQPLLEIEERVFEMTGLEQEHDEYREMLQATHEKLEIKEKHISEMKQKIPELLGELDMKTREKDEYKTTSKRYESELNKRKATQFDRNSMSRPSVGTKKKKKKNSLADAVMENIASSFEEGSDSDDGGCSINVSTLPVEVLAQEGSLASEPFSQGHSRPSN
jgi:predicted NodU family carbamoyl transferase